jgi:hypothetical protein
MGDRLDCGSDLLLELDGQPIRGMLRELDLAYKGTPMEHILPLMLIADVFGGGKSVGESLSDMVKMTRSVFRKICRVQTPKRRKTTYKTIRRNCAKRNRGK